MTNASGNTDFRTLYVDKSSDPNIAFLLAELKTVKARCSALEHIVTPPPPKEDAPIINAITSNSASVPTSIINNNNNFGPVQEYEAYNFEWMNTTAQSAQAVMGMNDILGPFSNLQSAPRLTPAIHDVGGMDPSFVNEDLQAFFNFDLSTFPSDPNSDSNLLGPVVQGASVAAPVLGNSAPTAADGSGPILATSSSVASPLRSVHHCTHCMKSYSRLGDLRRHARSHDPNASRLSCPNANCTRQFLRMDNLNGHRARKNH